MLAYYPDDQHTLIPSNLTIRLTKTNNSGFYLWRWHLLYHTRAEFTQRAIKESRKLHCTPLSLQLTALAEALEERIL